MPINLRNFFLGLPVEGDGPGNSKKAEPEKNEMEFGGDISPDAFKKLVDGGQDGTGRYKKFIHSQYAKKLEDKLEEIVEARKKEGRTFSKDYARQLANKLSNESDAASKELAKIIRGEE